MELKFSHFSPTLKDIDEENYTVRAVFSTNDVDRHGEVVDQKSWNLDSYLKNPVILYGHDHNQPPVGKVIGLGYNEDGNLEGTIKFAAKEYPYADVIWKLYKGGFMRAFSVGFASKTVDVIDGQVVLKDNELYEISTVSVPANAMALAKSKGLNVEPLETKLVKELSQKLSEIATEEKKECEEHSEKDCANCPPSQNVRGAVVNLDEEAETTEVEATVEEEEKDIVEDETPGDTVSEETTELEVEETETKAVETDDKGAVADELAAVDDRQAKMEKLQSVWDIIDAFLNVVWDEKTTVEEIPALISEMGDLLKAEAGDTASGKALVEAIATLSVEMKAKSAEELMTRIKEGRVLSKTNRTAVENAIDALQKVLEADKPKEDKSEEAEDETSVLRANIAEKTSDITVATPAAGVAKTKTSQAREINKAVRSLLAKKAKLKR